ncbi:hypothetical protein BC628DRAFT_1337653 [Trametes gibbosa]|nr:hypothetical protein BC628DRAFT_1337653 [Trametes gibbosa]
MLAFSNKVQNRPTYNRAAADYLLHGPRSFSPALQNLDPEQRLRLAKSSQKIGKMLGQMPTIDVMPASPGADSLASTTMSFEVRPLTIRKKGGKSKRKLPPPPAPVMRYRLPPVNTWNILVEDEEEVDPAPRRPIPAALNLDSPGTTVAKNRQSVFPYGYMNRTPLTPEYLSPLTPISPLSPIKTPDIHEHRMQTLRRLARMSRAFRDTIVEELAVPPANAAATPEVHNVKTYLDLYRMSVCPRRRSHMPPAGRRRSRSVGGELQRRSVLSVYSAGTRTSFVVPPSPSTGRHGERGSYIIALGFPSAASPSPSPFPSSTPTPTCVSHRLPRTPFSAPSTPPAHGRLLDDSPLQQQQSVAQAKAVILGSDAQFMDSFRRGFQIRTRRRASGKRVPGGTTTTTPSVVVVVSPFAGGAKSPKVPYWVRSASRAGGSGHVSAGGSGGVGGSRRRRAGVSRPPPTPRTMRKERRQGWGGEWRKMGVMVEKLREMETAAKALAAVEAEAEVEVKVGDAGKQAVEGVERKAEEPGAVDKVEVEGAAAVESKDVEKEDDSLLAYLQEEEEMEDAYSGIVEEARYVEAM